MGYTEETMPVRKRLFNWFFLILFSLLTVPGWPLHVYLEDAGWVSQGVFSYGSNQSRLFDLTNHENGKGTVHSPDSCVFCAFFHILGCAIFVLLVFAAIILLKLFMDYCAQRCLFVKSPRVVCARAPPF